MAGSQTLLLWEAKGEEEPLRNADVKRHHSETRANPDDMLDLRN
jgi:hypothetical protein